LQQPEAQPGAVAVQTPPREPAGTVPQAQPEPAPRGPRLGAFPYIALACAAGVAIVAVADALSRTGHRGGNELFWVAIALMTIPATLRMTGQRAGGSERSAILVVYGLSLYALKVLQDPFSLTYADELVHFHNLQSILSTGRLFGANPILPITPRYPGVEATAAAIVRMTGVSPFAAALILIGAARVMIMLAMYAFFERVSGSPRAAGVGALVYAATPTFLFFDSQFSYESLALPLATVALFAVARWGQAPNREARRRWATMIVLIAAAVVATHHVTAYALVVLLIAVTVLHWQALGRRGAPWAISAAIGVLATAWLVFAAAGTIGYLSPVISDAVNKIVQTLNGQASTRVLFANQGGVESTPVIERGVAILGILMLGLWILGGSYRVWRRRWRRSPLVDVLAVASFAYLGTLFLRFIPAAWETASRASEFLFVGVAFIVALGVLWIIERRKPERWRTRLIVALTLGLVLASGIIAGWPSSLRLSLPLRVKAQGHTIQPPTYVAAIWSGEKLGPSQRVAAEDSDARLFLDYAHQTALTGTFPDVDDMLTSKNLNGWHFLLRNNRITLVETDQRKVATDVIAGYYFNVGSTPLLPAVDSDKFNLPDTDRIYDGGSIVIYGVRRLW
jgi:hypothetical protein